MEDRKVFINKMAVKLKEWDAEIQKLEAKADTIVADKKLQFKQLIEDLRMKKEETQTRLNEIRDAGNEAWVELKEGVEKSWNTLEGSLKNALNKFK